MTEKNRIQHIDRLKGFAIILVVIGHIFFFSYQDTQYTGFRFISSFHMPLFMFLSGYVIITPPKWKKAQKKIIQFILPMFVWGIVFSFYCMKRNILNLEDWNIVISTFIMSSSKMGYWYLFDLALFYAVLVIYQINNKNKLWIDIIITLIIYALFFVGWKKGHIFADSLCLLNATSFFPFFILGHFIRKYNFMNILMRHKLVFTVSLIGYIAFFCIEFPLHILNSISFRFVQPLLAIATLYCIFLMRDTQNSYIDRTLAFIGRNTLDIYVLHYFLVSSINFQATSLWLQKTDNSLLAFAIASVLGILIVFSSIFIGKLLKQDTILRKYAFGENK